MFIFVLKVLMLLIGLVLVAFQFTLWFVKKRRDELISARNKVMVVWIALLLILFAKIVYFR